MVVVVPAIRLMMTLWLVSGLPRRLHAASAERGLEGVVAKRLDAPNAEARRATHGVKQKHPRRERLVVTGWRERDGALPELFLARRVGSELHPAGSASLGLDPERREQLLSALAERELRPARRRRRVRWALPEIVVLADLHGSQMVLSVTPSCERSGLPRLSNLIPPHCQASLCSPNRVAAPAAR
jgi:ATP-dependent DNA ligase